MERVFGMHFRIEMYTPKIERVGGYYSMPILHDGRIVGVADPKVDRKDKRMTINFLSLSENTEIDDGLLGGISEAIKEVAVFTGCDTVSIRKTSPDTLKPKVERVIGSADTNRAQSYA
jgi:hypothetical protein